jgi:hypothetical protein
MALVDGECLQDTSSPLAASDRCHIAVAGRHISSVQIHVRFLAVLRSESLSGSKHGDSYLSDSTDSASLADGSSFSLTLQTISRADWYRLARYVSCSLRVRVRVRVRPHLHLGHRISISAFHLRSVIFDGEQKRRGYQLLHRLHPGCASDFNVHLHRKSMPRIGERAYLGLT